MWLEKTEPVFLTNKKLSLYFPLIFFEAFFVAGYLLYLFGPWRFPYVRDAATNWFVIGCFALFAIGYLLTIRSKRDNGMIFVKMPINRMIYVFIIVSAIIAPIYCYYRTGSVLPPINRLSDLSIAYTMASESVAGFAKTGWSSIMGLGYFFEYISLSLIYYYFNTFSKAARIAGVILCAFYFLMEMCTGHNKGIIIFCIAYVVMFVTKALGGTFRNNKVLFWRYVIVTLFVLILIPSYFALSMGHRSQNTMNAYEALGEEGISVDIDPSTGFIAPSEPSAPQEGETDDLAPVPGKITLDMVEKYMDAQEQKMHPYYYNQYAYAYADTNDALYRILPDSLRFYYVVASNYLTHGYHGLSIALHQPFDSAYGFGHSMALQSYLKRLTGIDVYKKTYVYKVNQQGYPISLSWGTAYLQFASDISFIGTVFLMALLGWFLATLWLESFSGRNPLSIILLTLMVFNLMMFTSWWQAGITGSDFVLFYGCLVLWIISKIAVFIKTRK